MWPFVLLWFVIILGTTLLVAYQHFFETHKTNSIADIAGEIEIIEEFR
ncbi:MAG: hypothetical protein NUW02_03680 [Candidatus Campbellbacteria bacterium]|nr:hypothetical protein [Candidatus Campbellbacteria bacterium]